MANSIDVPMTSGHPLNRQSADTCCNPKAVHCVRVCVCVCVCVLLKLKIASCIYASSIPAKPKVVSSTSTMTCSNCLVLVGRTAYSGCAVHMCCSVPSTCCSVPSTCCSVPSTCRHRDVLSSHRCSTSVVEVRGASKYRASV